MNDANKAVARSALSRVLQPIFWFLLTASTLAGATSLAMEMII